MTYISWSSNFALYLHFPIFELCRKIGQGQPKIIIRAPPDSRLRPFSNHLVRSSIHLSACPSSLRVRSITQKPFEIFHKIGTYSIIRQYAEIKNLNSPTFLWNYSPFKFQYWKLCLLNNPETLLDIFMKLCTLYLLYGILHL